MNFSKYTLISFSSCYFNFNITLFQGVVDEDTSEDEDDPEFGPDDDNNDDVKVEEHEVADEGHVFQSVVFTSETEAILI